MGRTMRSPSGAESGKAAEQGAFRYSGFQGAFCPEHVPWRGFFSRIVFGDGCGDKREEP